MPVEVNRTDVLRMVGEGAQLVEVLPQAEYDDEHLPGAVSIPLKELDGTSTGSLDPEAPVIAYCFDYQ